MDSGVVNTLTHFVIKKESDGQTPLKLCNALALFVTRFLSTCQIQVYCNNQNIDLLLDKFLIFWLINEQ